MERKMKQRFSTSWIGSKQPRKQRKYRANAGLHIRHVMMGANLSKELRKKYGKRSFPLRKGDSVRIMVGAFKKKTGKIDSVDLKKLRVMIEGIYRTKKDGTKVSVYFNPSNLQIKELNLEDKMRKKALERGKKVGEKKEEMKIEEKKEDKVKEKSEGVKEDKIKFKAKPLPKAEVKSEEEK